jgi:uncharacterized MnhB-related membrane protein
MPLDSVEILLVTALLLCALQAVRATRLLTAAIWLGAASAMLSLWLYTLGAHIIAVIELSVGAGLVTVLMVFVIGICGPDARGKRGLVPTWLAWGLVISASALLAALVLPLTGTPVPFIQTSFASVLWEQRALDILLQMILIFAGVIGVLGLLSDRNIPPVIAAFHDQEESVVPTTVEVANAPSSVESPRAWTETPEGKVRV